MPVSDGTESTDASWVGDEIDLSVPNAARMYDYYLGGAHNFAIDREQAERMLAAVPHVVTGARSNRAFLRRAVRFCLQQGVRQFLDLGAGIPTVGHVHEAAASADPPAKVAYVDNEPVAVAHTELLVADLPNVTMSRADLREPRQVLAAPGVRELLDFSEPVAILLVAVLHFLPDDDSVASLLATYRNACAPGSYLVVSHLHDHGSDVSDTERALSVYRNTSNPVTLRDTQRLATLLPDACDPVEPGIVYAPLWRPEPGDDVTHPHRSHFNGLVAEVVRAQP